MSFFIIYVLPSNFELKSLYVIRSLQVILYVQLCVYSLVCVCFALMGVSTMYLYWKKGEKLARLGMSCFPFFLFLSFHLYVFCFVFPVTAILFVLAVYFWLH